MRICHRCIPYEKSNYCTDSLMGCLEIAFRKCHPLLFRYQLCTARHARRGLPRITPLKSASVLDSGCWCRRLISGGNGVFQYLFPNT